MVGAILASQGHACKFVPFRATRKVFRVYSAKGFGFAKPAKVLSKDGRQLLQPGKVSPMCPVPEGVPKPAWFRTGNLPAPDQRPQIHNSEGIQKMRAAGRLAAETLQYAGSLVRAGVTTDSIDKAVHAYVTERGAYPSPLNYGKFPKSLCTSVNECICHGIPDDRVLQDGDIVNLDVTVYLNGYHGDTSSMFYVGEVKPEARKLCEVTKQALDEAIKICAPGVPYNKIGATIQWVAESQRMGVVRDFVGHGVGTVFHAAPIIFHYANSEPGVMQRNQTFTIEPMLVAPGGTLRYKMWDDKWTVVTADGSLSAQYEHTLLITDNGAEILTQC